MQAYDLHRRAHASIETVFAVLADGAGWSSWTRVSKTSVEHEGDPAPDGVGAVRRFGTGPVTTLEEVIGYEPPAEGRARFAYRLLSGLPVKGYQAEVILTADEATTDIAWTADFRPGPPGTRRLTASFLRATVGAIADSLVTEAERRTAAE